MSHKNNHVLIVIFIQKNVSNLYTDVSSRLYNIVQIMTHINKLIIRLQRENKNKENLNMNTYNYKYNINIAKIIS